MFSNTNLVFIEGECDYRLLLYVPVVCRYTKFYPSENNAWGEFQCHRRVFGIVCFAKCNDPRELDELYKLYEDIKSQYGSTVYDSRLIVFGLDPDASGSRVNTPDVARKRDVAMMANNAPCTKSNVAGSDVAHVRDNIPDVVPKSDSCVPSVATNNHQASRQKTNCDDAAGYNNGQAENVEPKDTTDFVSTRRSNTAAAADVIYPPPPPVIVEPKPCGADDHLASGDDAAVSRDHRSSSMTSQSSAESSSTTSSSVPSFVRDAPSYALFFLDAEKCPKLEGKR